MNITNRIANRMITRFVAKYLGKAAIGERGKYVEGSLARALDKFCQEHSDAIIRGDAFAAMKQRFAKNPEVQALLSADLSDPKLHDIRRNLIFDGRFLDGALPTEQAARKLTDDVLEDAVLASARYVVRRGVSRMAMLIGTGAACSGYTTYSGLTTPSDMALRMALVTVFALAGSVTSAPGSFASLVVGYLRSFMSVARRNLDMPTVDTLVTYFANEQRRTASITRYGRMVTHGVDLAEKGFPTIPIGVSTGHAAFYGAHLACSEGDIACIDSESLMTGIMCLGDTGTGKSYFFLRTLINKILRTYHQENSDVKLGMVAMDGKGTFWRTVAGLEIVKEMEKSNPGTVKVVGIKDGECGIDLLAGLNVNQVASVFERIMQQEAGGDTKNNTWRSRAATHIQMSAILCDCMRIMLRSSTGYLDDVLGRLYANHSPWSIKGIMDVALNTKVRNDVIAVIADIQGSDAKTLGISQKDFDLICGHTTSAALDHFEEFKKLANETSSSIVGNLDSFKKMLGTEAVLNRFCLGKPKHNDDVVDATHPLNGGILLINIGSDAADRPGEIVATMILNAVKTAARRRHYLTPDICSKNLCAIVVDECNLIFTSSQDPVSDNLFWGYSRSMGILPILASQSIAALSQVFGSGEAISKFLTDIRTHIVFTTTDENTIAYEQAISGNVIYGSCIPGLTYYQNQYQRQKARPAGNPKRDFDWLKDSLEDPIDDNKFTDEFEILEPGGMRAVVDPDFSMVPQYEYRQDSNSDNADMIMGIKREIIRTADEKNKAALQHDLKEVPLFSVNDFTKGGRIAVCRYQRAGEVFCDILDIKAIYEADIAAGILNR